MKAAKFEVNKVYKMLWVGDSDLVTKFLVVKRTAKTVSIIGTETKEIKTCRISFYDDIEQVFPMGKYSMAPVLKSSREVISEQPAKSNSEKPEYKPVMKVVYKKSK